MEQRLEQLHDDVATLAGKYMADRAPSERAIDEALRSGLSLLHGVLPPAEATVDLIADGAIHDLAQILDDLWAINWVVYPWVEKGGNRQRGYPTAITSRTVVRFGYGAARVGDKLRVSYRRRYRLAGLDRASADTLPEDYDRALAMAAAADLLRTHATQLYVEDAATNGPQCAGLRDIADELADAARSAILDLLPYQNPVWGPIGL